MDNAVALARAATPTQNQTKRAEFSSMYAESPEEHQGLSGTQVRRNSQVRVRKATEHQLEATQLAAAPHKERVSLMRWPPAHKHTRSQTHYNPTTSRAITHQGWWMWRLQRVGGGATGAIGVGGAGESVK